MNEKHPSLPDTLDDLYMIPPSRQKFLPAWVKELQNTKRIDADATIVQQLAQRIANKFRLREISLNDAEIMAGLPFCYENKEDPENWFWEVDKQPGIFVEVYQAGAKHIQALQPETLTVRQLRRLDPRDAKDMARINRIMGWAT